MRRLVLLVVLALSPLPAFAQEAAPPASHRQPMQLTQKPSGFWTSPHDASDRPYRWGKMAIAGVLLLGTGFLMLRLVKRANAERAARAEKKI